MARNISLLEVLNYGIAGQPSQSRQPHCIVSRKSLTLFSFRFHCRFLTLLYIIFKYFTFGFIVSFINSFFLSILL